jgi:hypothetical protein
MSYNRWNNSDELYHYGVLGMKWGVRRARNLAKQNNMAANDGKHIVVKYKDGRRAALDSYGNSMLEWADNAKAKVDRKASKKLENLNKSYEKRQARADRKFAQAERKASSLLTSKKSAQKAFDKASKYQFKANKAAARGKKWYEQMLKEYKRAGIPMSKENQEIGKELIRQIRANSRAMYAASYVRG